MGVIPTALIHWQMTGDDSDMRRLLAPAAGDSD
jgi:hypothetical protein